MKRRAIQFFYREGYVPWVGNYENLGDLHWSKVRDPFSKMKIGYYRKKSRRLGSLKCNCVFCSQVRKHRILKNLARQDLIY